jgi:hypothetical protein
MWRSYFQKWSPPVVAALAIYLGLGFGGTPVQAQHLGHKQAYDVVQGYIIQCQAQTQACAPSQMAAPSAQNQSAPLAAAPQAPTQTVTLQLAQQAPVQTVQLAAPVQMQTVQLAAPVQMQTVQLAAPVQMQTVQLAAPVQMQTVQLAAPVQMQTVQLAAQPVAAQCAVPITLLLPRHKCHFFCRHYNCTK